MGGALQRVVTVQGGSYPSLNHSFPCAYPSSSARPSPRPFSVQLLQKKTTMQFKTLDSTLQTIDANTGRKEATTYRCADIDKMVPSLMGVSKVWGGCGTSVGVSQVWGGCVGVCGRVV